MPRTRARELLAGRRRVVGAGGLDELLHVAEPPLPEATGA